MIFETNTARTSAALSATNEAILYAKSPEELLQPAASDAPEESSARSRLRSASV
jgi:hypothetical protein